MFGSKRKIRTGLGATVEMPRGLGTSDALSQNGPRPDHENREERQTFRLSQRYVMTGTRDLLVPFSYLLSVFPRLY